MASRSVRPAARLLPSADGWEAGTGS